MPPGEEKAHLGAKLQFIQCVVWKDWKHDDDDNENGRDQRKKTMGKTLEPVFGEWKGLQTTHRHHRGAGGVIATIASTATLGLAWCATHGANWLGYLSIVLVAFAAFGAVMALESRRRHATDKEESGDLPFEPGVVAERPG